MKQSIFLKNLEQFEKNKKKKIDKNIHKIFKNIIRYMKNV